MRRHGSALVVSAALLAIPVQTVAAGWTYASSEHFEIYTTAGPSRARDALAYFEHARAFFSDFLHLTPRAPHPTRLILFSNAAEYAPYRLNDASVAFYQPAGDRDDIVMRDFTTVAASAILVHEYAHLVIRYSGARFPLWLNEGLAEFLSTMTPAGRGAMKVGGVPEGRLRDIAGRPVMALTRLFAIDRDSPEYDTPAHAGLFYSESWALTHLLLTSDRYQARSGQFLAQMAGGADEAEAFMTVYGESLPMVERALLDYLSSGNYASFVAPDRTREDTRAYATRAAGAFDVDLALANLVAAEPDREAQARAAFDALARDHGDVVGLAESRAYFEFRHGHVDEAAVDFAHAVSAGSTSAALYRDYASLLVVSDPAAAEPIAARAVALDGANAESRLVYADVLMRRGNAAGVVAALAPIADPPVSSAYTYFRLEAAAAAALGKFDEARREGTTALDRAPSAADREAASRFLLTVNDELDRRGAVASEASTIGAPPALALRGADPSALTIVEGRLVNLVCSGTHPVLEVDVNGSTVRLVIDNPLAVRLVGAGGAATALSCGTQHRTARVGYLPAPDEAAHTAGDVRMLDLR